MYLPRHPKPPDFPIVEAFLGLGTCALLLIVVFL